MVYVVVFENKETGETMFQRQMELAEPVQQVDYDGRTYAVRERRGNKLLVREAP